MKKLIIAIDFDGTIVQHNYPFIGKPLEYAKETINVLAEKGHLLFLYTMRSGAGLVEAQEFLIDNGYKISLFNQSPSQFSESPKQYAHLYIDDASLGCPCNDRGVDWEGVVQKLYEYGILNQNDVNKIFG